MEKLVSIAEVRDRIIPAASALLPSVPFTPRSNGLLLAIGLQESRFSHRRQIRGPATGFWQFERGGGVRGVMRHSASAPHARQLCALRGVGFDEYAIHSRLEVDDVLACGFARLLLWTDPRALPALGDAQSAWDYYIRNWRPGKPHRHTWDAHYFKAVSAVI